MDTPATLDALVQHYDDKIRRFLGRVTSLSQEDMDDAVQDVYLRFARNGLLTRFDGQRAAFVTYLYLVCESVARNRHRSISRRPVFKELDLTALDELGPSLREPSFEFQLIVDDLRARLAEVPEARDILARLFESGRLRPASADVLRQAALARGFA